MTDRIVFSDPSGAFGTVYADGAEPSYGPLPPAVPDLRAVYDRLVAAGVVGAYTPPPPAPDTIEGKLLVKALTDAQYAAIKTRDQDRIASDPSIPVGNSLMVRAAAKAGISVADWVAAARKPD